MEKKILKNKIVQLRANSYGSIFLVVYDRNDKGQLVHEREYKFDGTIEGNNGNGVDLEISVPPRCRTEYAKIIKLN